jgi:hypothetical protein
MAVNEFGAKLDRNGYAKSILQRDTDACCRCGRNGAADHLDRHEVFGGAMRQKSKELGLWVTLCHVRCHEGDTGVHRDREFDLALKRAAQRYAMERYGWSVLEFRSRFRNNYLDEEDIGDESAGGM